ncbi:AAA family ATPase [Bacteroides fragilis]|uniref:AAA family ATPase n=1 Tax=Bacteroides fragilis TaxID=817 RepID=UPI00187ACC9E|nr:AAA family ATPase [Bacteroides fragilis]MBE7401798.1 AAA family ATPase [Bacteroides fragilis]MCE8621518.1 AAA family ATPase [Bacteroides fragilis]
MIDSLLLNNFTSFVENSFQFGKGVNVLIGKNGTGKTHILKSLAASLQARHDFLSKQSASKEQFEYIIAEDLVAYFKPDTLGNLVYKNAASGRASVNVAIEGKSLAYSFATSSKTTVKLDVDNKWEEKQFIYIPPREMFSLFEGFIGLTNKREISFDQTYIKLAHSLSLPVLKDNKENPLNPAVELLEKELGFKVLQMNGRFYIQTEGRNMEAHLVAEGLRKLASILYLILNGEINEKTILFWDEPESNLNPALIKIVAKFILTLEQCGLQIFIATHDYLLTHTLSLHSEYKEHTKASVKFFSLNKEEGKIVVEEGDTLAEITNNPILEEYAAYYDLEQTFINDYE